jgi:hypothetical protein
VVVVDLPDRLLELAALAVAVMAHQQMPMEVMEPLIQAVVLAVVVTAQLRIQTAAPAAPASSSSSTHWVLLRS